LQARLGPSYIGKPIAEAIAAAGAPSSQSRAGSVDFLTWDRTQYDASLGQLSCRETLAARDGVAINYQRAGNC
jgi:hypothetical protein